jgi:hypothetical protein
MKQHEKQDDLFGLTDVEELKLIDNVSKESA